MAQTKAARSLANQAQGQEVPANVQRMVFIQALMERQWMPETEAKQIYRNLSQGATGGVILFLCESCIYVTSVISTCILKGLFGFYVADMGYSQLIAEANEKMETMKFRIKRFLYPVSWSPGWEYVCFVPSTHGSLARHRGEVVSREKKYIFAWVEYPMLYSGWQSMVCCLHQQGALCQLFIWRRSSKILDQSNLSHTFVKVKSYSSYCLDLALAEQDADASSKLHGSDYTAAQIHYLKALVSSSCDTLFCSVSSSASQSLCGLTYTTHL